MNGGISQETGVKWKISQWPKLKKISSKINIDIIVLKPKSEKEYPWVCTDINDDWMNEWMNGDKETIYPTEELWVISVEGMKEMQKHHQNTTVITAAGRNPWRMLRLAARTFQRNTVPAWPPNISNKIFTSYWSSLNLNPQHLWCSSLWEVHLDHVPCDCGLDLVNCF